MPSWGVKSTARKFGKNSPKYVAGFYALATLLIFVAGVLLSNGAAFYALWGAGSLLMIVQLWRWNKDDPASCLAAFRASRIYGMIIFAAFLLGFVI
jgi:4-hydroxybenzoate polyprenyltransferase